MTDYYVLDQGVDGTPPHFFVPSQCRRQEQLDAERLLYVYHDSYNQS